MSDEAITDYEDLSGMQLEPDELAELVGDGGECVFNWTNREGFPVGVVVAYVWRDGKFWTTCAARRARVPALSARPQSGVIINHGGRTASYKGNSIVHRSGDEGWDKLKTWFYGALAAGHGERGERPDVDSDYGNAAKFQRFLDSPHRVIIETEANLVVGFDTAKFSAMTAEAIAAGEGTD
ncbi:MAG: hypothetical protein ACR2PK_19080 [Acidimicrobiales bacterium]